MYLSRIAFACLLEERVERAPARLDRGDVRALDRLLQALPVLERELGVDRQPAGRAVVAAARESARRTRRARCCRAASRRSSRTAPASAGRTSSASSCTSPQAPRVLTLVSTRLRSPTPTASVCISPRPWCTCSSRVGHLLERRAEPLVQRRLQLLVDGHPHLLELRGVLDAQRVEPLLDVQPDRLELLVVALRELGHLAAQALRGRACSSRAIAKSCLSSARAPCMSRFRSRSRSSPCARITASSLPRPSIFAVERVARLRKRREPSERDRRATTRPRRRQITTTRMRDEERRVRHVRTILAAGWPGARVTRASRYCSLSASSAKLASQCAPM